MVGGPAMTATSRLDAVAVALLASLAFAATAAAPASATAAPSFTPTAFALSPASPTGSLRLRGIPGRVLRGAVRVRNVSGRPVTVTLHPADIHNASNGNADYVTTPLSQTGRWLHLASDTVRLAPRSSRQVAFTVSIPAGARGASHYAGIVAVNSAELTAAGTRESAKGQTFTFHRVNRQALPLTVRLPGRLTRSLALRSTRITVSPGGAGLVLGLLPGGSELIQGAAIKLRVVRGSNTIFTYASALGQLFPGAGLSYRIPWVGRPTQGRYHVLGSIRPQGAAAVNIDETIDFSDASAAQLKHQTPPAIAGPTSSMPLWVWIALAAAAALLIALSAAVWKLARRPPAPVA
jgi:hypothetical protein